RICRAKYAKPPVKIQDDHRLSSRSVRCRQKSNHEVRMAIRPTRSPVFHAIIARLELRRLLQRRRKRAPPRREPVTRRRSTAKGTVRKEDTMNEASKLARESTCPRKL